MERCFFCQDSPRLSCQELPTIPEKGRPMSTAADDDTPEAPDDPEIIISILEQVERRSALADAAA